MLVSIFIPTYNASTCIDSTLENVLGQTYSNLDVWVVDDCSTDDTLTKLQLWQKRDTRLHVLAKERNEGFVPYSWNRVFPHLKGEFTLYMSQDDYLSLECIEQLVNNQQKSDADAIIPNCILVYDDGRTQSAFSSSSFLSCRQAFARMLNYDIPGFALWRTSLIRSVGMPTEAWNSDEGMQRIWALHCKKGVSLCFEAIFYYHIAANSITIGLRPYHLTGLKTQQRLICTSIIYGIVYQYPFSVFRFAWQFFKSYIYLKTTKVLRKKK